MNKMVDKKYCDECGNEIKSFGHSLYGSNWFLWGLVNNSTEKDFCSFKCLVKYIDRLKEEENEKIKSKD